jgi:hypothetical protein
MVLRITVLPEQWAIINEIERESLKTFLRASIASHLNSFDDCEKTIIKLPRTTTKLQRYNIHRLSVIGFTSESYDNENEDRIMEIILSKQYVQTLFEGYQFVPRQVNIQIEEVPKTNKQKLFEALVGFINENLEEEFQNYMNSF